MIINHVREEDFKEVALEYPDFQYKLAEAINDFIREKYPNSQKFYPLLSHSDGKKLLVYVRDDLHRSRATQSEIERGKGSYKITIEPLG